MYLPRVDDERASLVAFIDEQLTALRASALGLDEQQARATPLRSALSIAGLVKHASWVMCTALVGGYALDADQVAHEFPDGFLDDFMGSFRLGAGETLADTLERFDRTRERYLAMCREGDLDAELPVGPMPWFGMDEPRTAALRYVYAHHLEEFARHAGHADIIREQLDGADAASLLAAAEGRPANAFVTPWTPA